MRKSILNMVVIAAATIGGTAEAATAGVWTKMASESASFTFMGKEPRIVRYGTGTQWVTRAITGSAQCTSAYFGKDPAPGKTKQCEIFNFVSSDTKLPSQPVTYNVKLSWTIPTTRQNGKPLALSELQGYEVYYTTDSSASADAVVKINGGSTSNSVISKLPAGTYYFSISAIDTSGMKSPLSKMVTAKVGG